MYKDDKKIHLINEDTFDIPLTDNFGTENDISLWALTNDEKVYTHSNLIIGDSTGSNIYQLRVKGNVEITGSLDASGGDFKVGNLDAEKSLSANGFKSTNLNTQSLTIEDRNFQIGFIDVALIDNLSSCLLYTSPSPRDH